MSLGPGIARTWSAGLVVVLLAGCWTSHPLVAPDAPDARIEAPDAGPADAGVEEMPGTDGGPVATPDAGTPFDPRDCSGGVGNAYFFSGEAGDFISLGGTFRGDASDGWSATPISASWVQVDVGDRPAGEWSWTFELRSPRDSTPLAPGAYEDAQRAAFRAPGRPGMSISGSGRACNTLRGRFTVHEIELDGRTLRRLRASYEQHCDEGEPRLVGCIRFEAPWS